MMSSLSRSGTPAVMGKDLCFRMAGLSEPCEAILERQVLTSEYAAKFMDWTTKSEALYSHKPPKRQTGIDPVSLRKGFQNAQLVFRFLLLSL